MAALSAPSNVQIVADALGLDDLKLGADKHLPRNGMMLWLDATDESSIAILDDDDSSDDVLVMSWKSKHPGFLTDGLQISLKGRNPTYPLLKRHLFSRGVYFDYDHYGKFNHRLSGARTIVSLHSFILNQYGLSTRERNNDGNFLANFYILCDSEHYHFHGNRDKDDPFALFDKRYSFGVSGFRNSTMRLGMRDKDIFTADNKEWNLHCEEQEGNEKIAILTLSQSDNSWNQIGRDRNCHHFCGVIHELIIYNRVLTAEEKRRVQEYLFDKHYGSPLKQMEESLEGAIGLDCIVILQSMLFPAEMIQYYHSQGQG